MDGTRSARLLRRTLIASAFAVSSLLAGAPIAMADPCPVLNPGCVLGGTTTPVEVPDDTTTPVGVPDDTTTPVGGVVDDTTTTVGVVVDDTTTTVEGVLDDTTTTVGGVTGGPGPIDPGTIVTGGVPGDASSEGGALPGGGGTPPGGGTTPPSGGGSTPGGTTQAGPSSSGTRQERGGIGTNPSFPGVVSAPGVDASTTVGHPFPSFLEGDEGTTFSGARLLRTLGFPLVLILLVIGFVSVQSRIDRKDPKLAYAPVGSDYLTFV